jgi:hypothetical protein
MEAPNDFDAAKSRDLEWAVWNRGERSLFLPRTIAVKNCGYIHPGPVTPPIDEKKSARS